MGKEGNRCLPACLPFCVGSCAAAAAAAAAISPASLIKCVYMVLYTKLVQDETARMGEGGVRYLTRASCVYFETRILAFVPTSVLSFVPIMTPTFMRCFMRHLQLRRDFRRAFYDAGTERRNDDDGAATRFVFADTS